MQIAEIIDRAKAAAGIESDSAFSKYMGLSRTAVGNWRSGVSLPDTVSCERLAGLTGLPLAQVLGLVGEARAHSSAEKAVWRKLAATAALLAVVVLGAPQAHAGAGNSAFSQIKGQMQIMSTGRGYLWRLLRDWLAHKLHRPKASPECMEASVCP